MTFPSLTPAQIIAAIGGAVFPILVLLGIDLNPDQTDAVEKLQFLALGLFGADAAIRVGRNLGNKAPSIDQVQSQVEDVFSEEQGRPPLEDRPVV